MSKAHAYRLDSALPRGAVASLVLATLGGSLLGCSADQSGQPAVGNPASQDRSSSGEPSTAGEGGDIPSCPCGSLANPLRGTITDVGEGFVRVRVDELLDSASGVEVGSEIEGIWNGTLPCLVGSVSVAAGDEVLAFYKAPEQCVRSEGVECSGGDTLPARISLTPWGDTAVLADTSSDLTISVGDLGMLNAPLAECTSALGNISDALGPDDGAAP